MGGANLNRRVLLRLRGNRTEGIAENKGVTSPLAENKGGPASGALVVPMPLQFLLFLSIANSKKIIQFTTGNAIAVCLSDLYINQRHRQ